MENTLVTIRPELLSLSKEQFLALSPWIWVLGGALAAMIFAVLFKTVRGLVTLIAVAATAGCVWSSLSLTGGASQLLFNKMMVIDSFTLFFVALFALSAWVTTVCSWSYLRREGLQHPEYYILVLFSLLGMMSMTASLDLVVTFVALELMSIAIYVLVGFRRADRRSNEAAVKYFVLGSAASAVFLYGSALVYGATGSVQILEIASAVQRGLSGGTALFALGAALVIFGFLFKVAAFPFQMWMPDVYEGAPLPITGFMTTGIKAASFATFIRVLFGFGYGHGLEETIQRHFHDILWVTAALTMLIGNLIALTQVNLKRLLAYSSIAHTGYLLLGALIGGVSGEGSAALYLYLISYAAMNLGAFAILSLLAKKGDSGVNLHDLAGLSRRRPALALGLGTFLFSMAGVPPTAGFAAKYFLFSSAVQAGEIWITVIAVLCSAISVYYYLRVLVYMYMREPAEETSLPGRSGTVSIMVLAMIVLTLQVGLFPSRWMDVAKRVSGSLMTEGRMTGVSAAH